MNPPGQVNPAVQVNAESQARSLPHWAEEMIGLYESNAASQFILHGNVHDRFLLPMGGKQDLGSLADFFLRVLLPRFDVVLSYDVGNGLRVEVSGEAFSQWPAFKENPEFPRNPRAAVEFLTRFFRYTANLARLGKPRVQVAALIHAAHLLAPASPGAANYDLSALALLIRGWSEDALLAEHTLVTCLIAENLNDLHPLLVNNPRAAKIQAPMPSPAEIGDSLTLIAPRFPLALAGFKNGFAPLAAQLAGATQHAIHSLIKRAEYRGESLRPDDLVKLKKQLVEDECAGLIEFVESRRSLDDIYGQEKLKDWLRQDFSLWSKGDLSALPMGYLICGPVGTGKTYLVECLAGEAGVPVVKIKNFRDRWVGSTEGNLEKIFRLLHGLTRCFVFIDEADQALGRRDSGANDSGLSGRIYSMMAAEMSRPENRGRILWILASSRPDLIEVDLKRPGRVDVKIPIFPTVTPEESFDLIRALCHRVGIEVTDTYRTALESLVPLYLTPGAAEALAMKVYRLVRAADKTPLQALKQCLEAYQNPVPADVMDFQIGLAAQEASDLDFIPPAFLHLRQGVSGAPSSGFLG